MKKTAALFLYLLSALLLFSACGRAPAQVSTDPHEGEIFVEDESGGRWIPLYEDLPAAAYDSNLFYADGEYINYGDADLEALRGIDVSSHQGEIDWAAVRADGVDFAMIRACYRGYTEGGLFEDEFCRKNIEGALANGIQVGLYAFSQAVSPEEAVEEAQLCLSIAADYAITMPIVFDWEHIGGGEQARTDGLPAAQITDCAIAFCSTVQEAGFVPMVYFYESLGYDVYDLGRLADYDFWLADPGETPGFYYNFSMWQYSFTAAVSGIEGDVDLNLCFKDFSQPAD